VNTPELKPTFTKAGLNVAPLTAEEITSVHKAEYARLQQLVKRSGYVPE
jgi:hypothetical protein